MAAEEAQPFVAFTGAGSAEPVFVGLSVPEGVRDGDPRERITYHVEDERLRVNVGFWEGQPGEVRFDGFPWNEFCVVLSGELEVRPDGAEPVLLRAGDAFFIRKAFHGTWRLRTPVTKYFVEALVED